MSRGYENRHGRTVDNELCRSQGCIKRAAGIGSHVDMTAWVSSYIRQVNGTELADILFSLLCVCLCVSVRTQSSLQQSVSLQQRISHLQIGTRLSGYARAVL